MGENLGYFKLTSRQCSQHLRIFPVLLPVDVRKRRGIHWQVHLQLDAQEF